MVEAASGEAVLRNASEGVNLSFAIPSQRQADGYAGFHHPYEGGRIVEAAC